MKGGGDCFFGMRQGCRSSARHEGANSGDVAVLGDMTQGLRDLAEGFRRLFWRRNWEAMVEDGLLPAEGAFDVIELLAGNLQDCLVERTPYTVQLRSPGGQTVRVSGGGGQPWPARIVLRLPRDLRIQVEPVPRSIEGEFEEPGQALQVGDLLLEGQPLELMRALSPSVLGCLRGLVKRDGDALRSDDLHLALPSPDSPWSLLKRVRLALKLVDVAVTAEAEDVLAQRFGQRQEVSWSRCALRALARIGTGHPRFPALQLAFMLRQPDSAVAAASLDFAHARSSLNAAVRDPATRSAALRVLLRMPSDPETAVLLAEYPSLELALLALERHDGFLAEEAWEELDRRLDAPPPAELALQMLGLASRAEPSQRARLLTRLAPWFRAVPRAKRVALAEAVIRFCAPATTLELTEPICASAASTDGPLPRAGARRLVPKLLDHPRVDAALREFASRSSQDAAAALTRRFAAGRSLPLLAAFTEAAPSMPRPAADDLVLALHRDDEHGLAVLRAFLEHEDPDVVTLAAAPLGRFGGHDELLALGGRTSQPDTSEELQASLRAAMDAIEVRLGPIQRGGLSVATQHPGELALIAEAGELALTDEDDA